MIENSFPRRETTAATEILNGVFAFAAALIASLPALLSAGDLFEENGVLTSALHGGAIDTTRCLAFPGRRESMPGVLRVDRRRNHAYWETEPAAMAHDCHYVIALKRPTALGTVLVAGAYEVSFLRDGAEADPAVGENWIAVKYPGETHRRTRAVALPPGTVTGAIRLTAVGEPNREGSFQRSLALATAFAGRFANIAPMAEVQVSSSLQPRSGFQPDPRRSDPETLVDGSLQGLNWSSAERDEPISAQRPETIVFDWHANQEMRGCVFLFGSNDSGAGTIIVQQFIGEGEPEAADDSAWRTITEVKPRHPWRPPLCWEAVADFGGDIRTRALRFLMPAGLPETQAEGGEGARPNAVSFGEILILRDLHETAAPDRIARRKTIPDGVLPITFHMPKRGKASIRIVDAETGAVVENVVNGEPFEAGEQTVWWDLATIDDFWPPFERFEHGRPLEDDAPRIARPGRYRWEGIWHPGLSLEYLDSYYPLKKHGLAWTTADTTGGWLADHMPPQTIVRVGDRMWTGTFCEEGHALLEADLDMKKLWGSARIWLACPRVMAVGGEQNNLYFVEQGGWTQNKIVMIEVDPRTKRTRRLLAHQVTEGEDTDIQGLAVVGQRAYLCDRSKNEIAVLDLSVALAAHPTPFGWAHANEISDHERMRVERTIAVPRPSRIRPYDETHLAVVSDTSVLLLNLDDNSTRPLIAGLTHPQGLAVDENKNVYVGEMAPSHQVKVFDAGGQLVRVIGQPGPHRIGPFDPGNLESPAAVEVDADGNVWVCEMNHELKRTSVWDREGRCVNQVLGPTIYGGAGDIDPRNENRFFYKGKEFERDPQSGAIALTKIIWRGDDDTFDDFFPTPKLRFGDTRPHAMPAYPFYHGDRLFFTSWQGWGAGQNTTVWLYDGDRVRPVAAIGAVPDWLTERLGPDAVGDKSVCAWTDRNDDGRVQQAEVKLGAITFDGKPWETCGTAWQFRMNHQFEAAVSDGKYGAAGIAFFHVEEFSDKGYPVYTLPTKFHPVPFANMRHAADAVFTDRQGNAISLDDFVVSMKPDGTVNWRYKNRWPGLHAGHSTAARGDEPGVLIAPTRFLGSCVVNEEIGEIICIGGNLGTTYLFTEDGFYVGNVFQDARVGLHWSANTPPSPDVVKQLSLSGEHFGGTLNQVRGTDGRDHVRFVVGKAHCSVVELHGLEGIARLPGGEVTVTKEQIGEAHRIRQLRALKKIEKKDYTIPRMSEVVIDGKPDEWARPRIDDFALGYDEDNLYVLFSGKDDRAPFANAAAENFLEVFKQGDVVDVKLETRGGNDPRRAAAAEGDIRLSFASVQGKPAAILYDFVVPGTTPNARHAFSSPWRTVHVDRVTLLPDARVAVERRADGYTLEASVPLKSIHLAPAETPVIRGDVGRVHSDQTGTRAVRREYWSNKNTNITSDVPSEAELQPSLWGIFRFASP